MDDVSTLVMTFPEMRIGDLMHVVIGWQEPS